MSDAVHTIEYFHGVYLLYCKNPQYKGRTYIGYTVDPNRRLKQHNKGKQAGGAWRTSKRGPWAMVLIIHGFPNDIAALRFEWAWQHPQSSRRLNHVARKKAKEKTYDYALRVLSEMLRTGPWNRLPLTISWLEQEFARDFPADKTPPIHMPICYGPVISKKLPKSSEEMVNKEDANNLCGVCLGVIGGKAVSCLNVKYEFATIMKARAVLVVCVVLILAASCDARSRRNRKKQALILRQKETNAIDFIRLAVMRLVYGIATRIGLGEQISEALNGAFVPPGVDEYDYGGFDLLDREDDYDYR